MFILGFVFLIVLCNYGMVVRAASLQNSERSRFNYRQQSHPQGYQMLPDITQYSTPQHMPAFAESYQPIHPPTGVLPSVLPRPSMDDSSGPLPRAPLHPSATNRTTSFYASTDSQHPPYKSVIAPPYDSQQAPPRGEPPK